MDHKLICLTDCQCYIDKSTLQEIVKKNTSINTCMVPPGRETILKDIESSIFNTGVHSVLNTDFTQENTINTWLECLSKILVTPNASFMQFKNDEDSISVYDSTNIDSDTIELSSRPVKNIDNVPSVFELNCSDSFGKYNMIAYPINIQFTLGLFILNNKINYYLNEMYSILIKIEL